MNSMYIRTAYRCQRIQSSTLRPKATSTRLSSGNAPMKIHDETSFFVTTPVFYVNAAPHIGHLYSVTIADAIHRFKKLQGATKTLFSTGTDEHGLKIQQAASDAMKSPEIFCGEVSAKFRMLFDSFGIGYSHFVRTTDEVHANAVASFYSTLKRKGFVYKGEYSGWYCVSDESFLTENQVVEKKFGAGESVKVSIESGNSVEWATETNYKFRLSSFQEDLVYWLKDNRVKPTRFLNDLRKMASSGLMDLSVSRPVERVSWGVPVPGDDSHSVYVWVDALVNYLTASGYPDNHTSHWPPDVQVLGKDILKFHGIYWPALLMAAGLEPPRQLLVHSHWTVDGVKMSKSRGNVVCPENLKETLTAEGVRYILLRQGTPHSDGSWREQEGKTLLNTELADTLGNLVHRCTGKIINRDQVFPELQENFLQISTHAKEISDMIKSCKKEVGECFNDYNFYLGIDAVMHLVRRANLMVQEEKPWELKNDPGRQGSVVHIALSVGRAAAIMLQPVVPLYAAGLLDMLGVPITHRNWGDVDSFPCERHKATPLGERMPPFTKIK